MHSARFPHPCRDRTYVLLSGEEHVAPRRQVHGGGTVSIACLVIPHFALRVALLDRPELDGAPLVLGPAQGGRPVVSDTTPEAAAHGVRIGLGLREAVALCPEAIILTPHPVRESAAAEQV